MMLRLFLIASSFLAVGSVALGDGFLCQSQEHDLNIKLYHRIRPEQGTRTASVMIISDNAAAAPNRTIAIFRNSRLTSKSLNYTAVIDLRNKDIVQPHAMIAGHQLSDLSRLSVAVDFVYGQRLASGQEVDAVARLIRRDGDQSSFEMICRRYLKN